MDVPTNPNNITTNKNNLIQNQENQKEPKQNLPSQEIIGNVRSTENNESINKKEEEKNNEESEEIRAHQKEQEETNKKKSIQQEKSEIIKKEFDSILEEMKKIFITNKQNIETFFEKINKTITSCLSQPCIMFLKDIINAIFIFLCKYFTFIKDNFKEIPLNIMKKSYNLMTTEMFLRFPNININNEKDLELYELVGDDFFYGLFKSLLPNDDIINFEFNPKYNSMYKYFMEYLFHTGYNKKFITDFLQRDDLDMENYLLFSDYAFQILVYCNDDYIKENDYNILLIRNFINKMNFYNENSNEYIKQNKDLYIKNVKLLINTYNNRIFGGLTRMLNIFIEKNLGNEIDQFIFCIYKPLEILLKQQKLELRINAIDHLSKLSSLYKDDSKFLKHYYNDYECVYEYTKKKLLQFLENLNILNFIFGENIHEALIDRSYSIFFFLYKNQLLSQEQISYMWKISQSKYTSISNSIISLFGKLLPNFSNNECNAILQTVFNMKYNEVNETSLKLLENFFISEQRHENLLNILYKYSNELSYYEGLSSNIINKSRNILVRLLFNKNYVNDLCLCIKNCLFCIDNNYLLNTNRNIFIEIMNEFIRNDKNQNIPEIFKLIDEKIDNFGLLIVFLNQKYSIFRILMSNLLFMKKLFIFFTEEAIQLKHLINDGNFDFDALFNINKLMEKYKEYETINNEDENKMDIDSENINSIQENNQNNYNNYNSNLLPKNKKDIEKYLSLIMNDFIFYFKNKLLKEKIVLKDEEIVNGIFTQFEFSFEKNTYQMVIIKIIEIIFTLHQVGNVYMERNIFNFLYKLLVENSTFKLESEIFYNFLKSVINLQINNYHLNLVTDKDIEYLCLEKIISNDIVKLPYSAYESFKLYLININGRNGNITYSKEKNTFSSINKINALIGFKTLIEFYISTKEPKTYSDSFSTLSNILEISASDMLNRNYILDFLFELLKQYKIKIEKLEKNAIEKIVFRRILKLISIINKTKVSKNLYDRNDINNILNIKIINNFFFRGNEQNIISYKVFKGTTIKEFKNELINKIVCNDQNNLLLFNNLMNLNHNPIQSLTQLKYNIISNNLFILLYNSQVLKKNDFTLDDYNINSNDTIIILNGAGADLNGQEFTMREEDLKEGYEQIKVVFDTKFNEEVMKEAIYKEKGDIQNAILFLAEQENVVNLLKEMEIKKKNEPKKKEELLCLEESKFNILLDILNEGDNDLNSNVWDLFGEIKFPDEFIMNSINNGFDNILKENNINKKILILKIINSVIFNDESFCKNNKLTKSLKNQWVFKFINNEKFMREILAELSQLKKDENEEINYSKIISIVINWFLKIFDKISNIIKNNEISKNNTIEDSDSNFNIIIDNEESKNNEHNETNNNNNVDQYGEFDICENDINNFIIILNKNNFVSCIYGILGVVLNFTKYQTQSSKKDIIKNICEILLQYLKIKQNDIVQFLEEEKKIKRIEIVLMSLKENEIRKTVLDFIKTLMENIKSNKTEDDINNNENNINNNNLQIVLLNLYYNEIMTDEIYNEELYEFYNFLINYEILNSNVFPFNKIISKFLNDLYTFYINSINKDIKTKNNEKDEQLNKIESKLEYILYILCCFNQFYLELLANEIESLLKEGKDIIYILYNSLFNLGVYKDDSNMNYLFSKEKVRSNAFNLLSIIISIDKKYFDIISSKVIKQHTEILPKKEGLPIFFPLRDFSKEKFIGLKNFGATCYLNSLFQQMFMIPTLYQDLFNFNITNENQNQNENTIDTLKYSTIYNMQLSFINLKKTYMSFYPPTNFINSFKTAFNGEPIHLGVQQDTDEFLAILCDELEKEAKKFGKENFLENSFKGKITNEIVSLEPKYPYYSQTEEPFYRITLDIKGHNNLEDALDAYIKGEILDGDNSYFVEKYKQKIPIKKRTSIKKIGNQIIIHLKRFEFDFMTFQNNKLNDYLKFPLNINFKKWTRAYIRMNEVKNDENNNKENEQNIISEEEKENLNDEKMNYELTGILIHSGASLQSGHYYSFIKDQESNKWYKFNDSRISEYDIDKDLEKECFGNINSKKNQQGKGAYLLFYTKKECIKKYKDYEKNIKVNENIIKQVEKENIDFIKLKSYVDESYKNFIIQFIRCSMNYLKDIQFNVEKTDYSVLMNKNILQEKKIYEKLISLLKGNKENNIDINDEEIKTLPENIEQIYEKCKTEIIYVEKDEKKNNMNLKCENISKKNAIKLLFYFTFGIIFQYNDRETKMNELILFMIDIIQQNPKYSVYILKTMEKHMNIFYQILFKYGFTDKDMTGVNRAINNLFKILFNSVYNFEKETYGIITSETFYIFIKNENGKLKIEKEYKSLFLRMFKKLFCDNLEKCRLEYLKDNLFLDIYNSIIISYHEASIISSKYLFTMTSIITNNQIPFFQSPVSPNFKMGSNNNYLCNYLYISAFLGTVLRCVTPGMILSKKKSPCFIPRPDFNEENPDFSIYPKIPENFDKYLEYYFFNLITFSDNSEPAKILYHTCFYDKTISNLCMKILNQYLKTNYLYYISKFDEILLRICKVLNLSDGLNEMRLETLFELEHNEHNENINENNNNGETLINYYIKIREQNPYVVCFGIYSLAKIVIHYQIIYEHFVKHKKTFSWVKDFYAIMLVNSEDKNGEFYKKIEKLIQRYPDLYHVIENDFVNKLEL